MAAHRSCLDAFSITPRHFSAVTRFVTKEKKKKKKTSEKQRLAGISWRQTLMISRLFLSFSSLPFSSRNDKKTCQFHQLTLSHKNIHMAFLGLSLPASGDGYLVCPPGLCCLLLDYFAIPCRLLISQFSTVPTRFISFLRSLCIYDRSRSVLELFIFLSQCLDSFFEFVFYYTDILDFFFFRVSSSKRVGRPHSLIGPTTISHGQNNQNGEWAV